MGADEFKMAVKTLGLTHDQMALMLDINHKTRRMEISKMCSGKKPLPVRVSRLMNAYLSGYRPQDWPTNT